MTTLLKERDVVECPSLSRSTIRRWVAEGRFPKPIRIGARRIVWCADDVGAWMKHHKDETNWKPSWVA